MSTLPTPDELLMSAGTKSATFPTIGSRITGTILTKPKVQFQTDIKSGEVIRFQSGDPRLMLVITVQTDLRESEDDDGVRSIYAKAFMLKAIREAVVAAEATGLDPGGQLTVVYTADGEATARGFDPPKLFQAHYVPPQDKQVADVLGLPEQGSGATPPPPSGPPAPPPPANVAVPPPNGQPPLPPAPPGISPETWASFSPAQRAALAPVASQQPQQPQPPAPPPGVDPSLWDRLSDEQKALLAGVPPF